MKVSDKNPPAQVKERTPQLGDYAIKQCFDVGCTYITRDGRCPLYYSRLKGTNAVMAMWKRRNSCIFMED